MDLVRSLPGIVDPLPGDRQQGRTLFKDSLRVPHQGIALALIELAIDQWQKRFEVCVAPL
jgi:hypothetical protein